MRSALALVVVMCACRTRPLDELPVPNSPPVGSCDLADEEPVECPTDSATPLVLSQGSVYWATVDGSHAVYAAVSAGGDETLEVAPLGGGAALTRFTATDFIFVTRGGTAFVSDTRKGLLAVPLDGGDPKVLSTPTDPDISPFVAADDALVYFGKRDAVSIAARTEEVFRVPHQGGPIDLLAQVDLPEANPLKESGYDHLVDIAVDSCSVFWLRRPTLKADGWANNDGRLYRVDKQGGVPQVLLDGLGYIGRLRLTDDSVFLIESRGDVGNRILRVAKDGSGARTIPVSANSVEDYVVDGTHAYFVAANKDGSFNSGWWSAPLDGSAAPSLIPALSEAPAKNIWAVFLDSNCRLLYELVDDQLIRRQLPPPN